MNPFSSAENLLRLCEVVSIVAGGFAVVALFGQIATGRVVNRRQAQTIEELRNKNLELEVRVAPRRLTGSQKDMLVKFLSDDPGAVAIVSAVVDPESADFADDFDSALRAAHWQTGRIINRITRGYGVSVGTFKGTTLGDTNRLDDALAAIGIPHEVKIFDEKEENTISPSFRAGFLYLVIDHKPTTPKNAK